MYMPYTYRDTDGCVGRSNECSLCRDLSTPYRNEIREYSEKYGTLKTLMKLLNEGEIDAKDVTVWGTEVDKQNQPKKREPVRWCEMPNTKKPDMKYNDSGCRDMTPYEALHNVQRE